MPSSSEKYIEKKFCESIKRMGGIAVKLLSTITGLPDRLCLLPGGCLFFAELKTTKKKAEARQKLVHRQIRALGFEVYVVDSIEEAERILKLYEL